MRAEVEVDLMSNQVDLIIEIELKVGILKKFRLYSTFTLNLIRFKVNVDYNFKYLFFKLKSK